MAVVTQRRHRTSEEGAELIEFALVFPLLMLVMFGIVDFGLLFQRYEVLTNAAREGARVRVLPGYTDTDAQARVTQYLAASGMTLTPTFTPVPPQAVDIGGACITIAGLTVSYPYTFTFVGPIVGLFDETLTNTTLTATAQMRYEGAAIACP